METFLENMHLTNDRATLRTTANHWRRYYDVPIQSSSSSTATAVPVLPHPEHADVYVSQPYEVIPDQLHILQSCWGRSAQHHSQGTTTSLFWPPCRSTPPSSPPATLQRTLHLNRPTVSPQQVHGPTGCETILARWICLTPVCNTPHYLSGIEKRNSGTTRRFCGLLTRYTVFPPFSNFLGFIPWSLSVYVAAWAFRFILDTRHSTPWLILLGPIHIALHPRLRHHWVPEMLDGLLDPEAFLVT